MMHLAMQLLVQLVMQLAMHVMMTSVVPWVVRLDLALYVGQDVVLGVATHLVRN
jgi:hypothetical protein